MRVMFLFPKWSYTIPSRRISHIETKRAIIYKIEAPFIDKISGLAIVKMLDKKAQNTMMLKLKFVSNLATLNVTNSSLEKINIWSKRDVRYFRFKVNRILYKIKDRDFATHSKQML